MDAVNDIATPSFDFFPIISVIPLFESVSLLLLPHQQLQIYKVQSSLLFLPPLVTSRHQSVPSLIDGLWSCNLSFSLLYFLKNAQGKSEQIKTILR